MKTVKWFKEGDLIPDSAVFLKSEMRVTGYEDSGHWQLNDTPIYTNGALYEIEVQEFHPEHQGDKK